MRCINDDHICSRFHQSIHALERIRRDADRSTNAQATVFILTCVRIPFLLPGYP